MSDMTVSAEAVEEVRPVELSADVLDEQLIGQLVDRARASGLQLTGEGGLLQQLTKRVLESALEGEITDHLGYEKHDPAGAGSGNSRNGVRSKTVLTDVGPVEITVPNVAPERPRRTYHRGVGERAGSSADGTGRAVPWPGSPLEASVLGRRRNRHAVADRLCHWREWFRADSCRCWCCSFQRSVSSPSALLVRPSSQSR